MANLASIPVSVVIPVYRGEHSLPPVIAELAPLTQEQAVGNTTFRVTEVILVHDGAVDHSDNTILALAKQYSFVKPLWLSRNFGQHPATLAGMASTTGQWIITMDEDGQQNPQDIAVLLGKALHSGAQLVYGTPRNPPPHGFMRNAASNLAKWLLIHVLGNRTLGHFNSFRCVEGELGRSLAAFCGYGVFLDVALSWVVARAEHVPVTVRSEGQHRSGYSFLRLIGHFWRMLLTSGTRPLQFISIMGALSIVVAFAISVYAIWAKWTMDIPVQGWTSMLIINCFFFGGTLLSLGIIAEYLAVALAIVMGKPLYISVSRPAPTAKGHIPDRA